MPRKISPNDRSIKVRSFNQFTKPLKNGCRRLTPLEARGNRPLQMNFEKQLYALLFFHLEEFKSGRHLLQVLDEDNFASDVIAPPKGIKKSSFFEAVNNRGLEQLMQVYQGLLVQATEVLPTEYSELGNIVAIDGSLINAVLSMEWADYRKGSKKAKIHLGFDLNHTIPSKLFLTHGKADERPFVTQILSPGQTGVMDRYHQCHKNFDLWQDEGKNFVCRIQDRTKITCIEEFEITPGSSIFYDAKVLLGTPNINQTEIPLRLVGYRAGGKIYWVATNRFDLSAEQIALIYKLRWEIEKFFAWWKRHLKVYHLIARSEYGLMVQILAGLITYLLLAIYCHEQHKEKVSIKRVRELRNKIHNEARELYNLSKESYCLDELDDNYDYAKT